MFLPLLFFGKSLKKICVNSSLIFGRIHQWSHLVLGLPCWEFFDYWFNLFTCYRSIQMFYFSWVSFGSLCIFRNVSISSRFVAFWLSIVCLNCYFLPQVAVFTWLSVFSRNVLHVTASLSWKSSEVGKTKAVSLYQSFGKSRQVETDKHNSLRIRSASSGTRYSHLELGCHLQDCCHTVEGGRARIN